MAQAIFKSWFLDFEPWSGVMPDDWHEGVLGDICEITSGKRPPYKQDKSNEKANVPLVGASSVMGYTDNVLFSDRILITGRVGTHGIVQRFSTPCWPSDNTLVIMSDYYEFVYQQLLKVDFSNMNRGSTQPLITQTDLKNVPILLAPVNIILKFEATVETLMLKYEHNIRESEKLAEIRDKLLPRLMSGELSVVDI